MQSEIIVYAISTYLISYLKTFELNTYEESNNFILYFRWTRHFQNPSQSQHCFNASVPTREKSVSMLLVACFSAESLVTYSLTGQCSSTSGKKKSALDPVTVASIIGKLFWDSHEIWFFIICALEFHRFGSTFKIKQFTCLEIPSKGVQFN